MLVPAIVYKGANFKRVSKKILHGRYVFGNGKSLSMVAGDIR